MRKIEYDIKFDGDIPYILLSDEYEDNTENKFMIMFLAVNLLGKARDNAIESGEYDQEDKDQLNNSIEMLTDIVFYLSDMLKSQNEVEDEANNILSEEKEWDVEVDKIADRNNLPDFNIIYDDKIFERKEYDFKVYVKSTKKTYHLVGGISNNNWKEYNKEEK